MVGALMDVGTRLDFKAPQGLQHGFRHLCRRSIVEIMKVGIGQAREFTLQSGRIECSTDDGAEIHGEGPFNLQ